MLFGASHNSASASCMLLMQHGLLMLQIVDFLSDSLKSWFAKEAKYRVIVDNSYGG